MTSGRLRLWFYDLTLILGVCFLLFFHGIGAVPFFDKQEAREALVIWEIHHSGNWILPLRNGNEIPAKPPFYHWLGAVVSKIANRVDEATTRLPSAFLGTLGVLLTYAAGVALWGRSAGLVAALVLSTSLEWRETATAARVDMTFTFLLLCSFLFFLYLYRSGGGWKKSIFLGFLLGLATLAKGPLGFVVPSFTVLIFLWARRDFSFFKKLHPFTVMGVCFLVAGSWYALALWQGGKDFLIVVIRENFPVLLGEESGHPHPFYWYIPVFLRYMAPWSLFLFPIGIFLYRYRHRTAEEEMLYVVVWFVTVFVFFSAFAQKRPVYILSLYPAAALLLGAWLHKLKDQAFSSSFLARLVGYVNGISFLCISAMLLFQAMGPGLLKYVNPALGPKDQARLLIVTNSFAELRFEVFVWAALCGLGGIFLVLAVKKDAWGSVIGCTTVLMVASFLFIQDFSLYIAREYTFKPFIERVLPAVKDADLFFYGSGDYPVIFYARRHIPAKRGIPVTEKGLFYLLFWEDEWKQILNKEGLSLLDTSDAVDIDEWEHGHLLLVAVKT
jgi:4-amino-4-deoxy-L-arabinose transferase-like glycosyltransferase